MHFCIFRHGIAIDRDDPDCPEDPKRYLTREGEKKTLAAAKGLRKLGVEFDVWVTSPYVRAVQTAEIVAEAFGVSPKSIKQSKALLPGAHPSEIYAFMELMRADGVIAFGHAPNVDEAIAMAVGSRSPVTQLKKAGAAILEMRSLSPPNGEIIALFPPKSLRMMGKL